MKLLKTIPILLLACLSLSCEKFLEVKPDKKLAVPSDKLASLKLLLDDTNTMNLQYPAFGEVASDNVYIHDSMWQAVTQVLATSGNAYLWQRDVFNDADRNDWSVAYNVVFNANLALEGTEIIPKTAANEAEWSQVRGSALFFRSFAFYTLLQEFAKPFHSTTSGQAPGIVLKLSTDINEGSQRASVKACYEQVVADLEAAVPLLPVRPAFKTEPSRPAAYGLLARTLLTTGDYRRALEFAEKALELHPDLLDYRTLNEGDAYPLPRNNEEVIFHATLMVDRALVYPYGRIDEKLYDQYAEDDLRKSLFFNKYGPDHIQYRGSYDGSYTPFGGIASDEIYLIAAECQARTGNRELAMDRLNQLLLNRWAGAFIPLTADTDDDALRLILVERRKELLLRNLRFSDLNRLNAEPAFRTTIEKVSMGQTYRLTPENPYVFPIPLKVIEASGMEQN